ncbi:hypothetical protein M8J75_007651 [Diaphorina citri]|nr:hypothetical protein M8J75_007651 [Diaphorina citri]
MGKKTKKTRWRTLPIDVGASSNDHDNNHNHHPCEDIPKLCHSPVTTETKIYFNEDEYTKITTPRQDVLFKKGYFARRRYQLAEANSISDPNTSLYEIPNGEYVEDEDYFHEEYDTHAQGYYNSTHTYIPDPSAGVYYNYGNSSYEVYDPYTGSMTVLMGPPPGPPYSTSPGAPPLTAPMSVDWYNSTSQHASPYYTKRFPGDSSQTYTSPESMCPPTSPQDVDDPTLYPHSFIYPGYMLAANTYHTNGGGGGGNQCYCISVGIWKWSGAPQYLQWSGGPQYLQWSGGPQYLQWSGAPQYLQWSGAPQYLQWSGGPQYLQWSGGPQYLQWSGGPQYLQWSGAPQYLQWSGAPQYLQWSGGPQYLQWSGAPQYLQWSGAPQYLQWSGGPQYLQWSGGPQYLQWSGGPQYLQWSGAPQYLQWSGAPQYLQWSVEFG